MDQYTPARYIVPLVPSGSLRTLHPAEVFGENLPLVEVEEDDDGWHCEYHH